MKVDISGILAGLEKFGARGQIALGMYCDTASKNLEAYAKQNAPWKDRTGAARQRLKGTYERVPKGYRIKLSHGVSYGVHLEKAHEEKYAILQPTIDHKGPEVIRGMEKMLER